MGSEAKSGLIVQILWSVAGVLAASAIITLIYQVTVPEYAGKVPYWPYIRWQLIAYSFWVVGVPAVITFARWTVAVAWPPLRKALTHLGACVAIVGVHVAWIEAALFLVGVEVQFFYLHWITVPDVALYGALSLGMARARDATILAESERNFRSIFENAVVGIFRSTPDGRFLMLNQVAAEAIGYASPAEAIAAIDDIGEQVYRDPEGRRRYLEAIRRDGVVSDYIWCMRRADGSMMWNSENSRGVFDDAGNLLYIEGTAKDVTGEFTAREELRESERRSAELRLLLSDAKLRALKDQLKPHFLFNILNTIAMMIRNGDTRKAQRMVTLLGDMFRRLLELEGSEVIPLAHELEFVELYLSLEQLRFEDRMTLGRMVEPGVLETPVPTLIMQPIVENAIRHGVARVAGRCRLHISACRRDDCLVIEVVNDMRPPAIGEAQGYGIGTRNVRARIHEMYGDRATFDLVPDGDTMTATLRLPMETVT